MAAIEVQNPPAQPEAGGDVDNNKRVGVIGGTGKVGGFVVQRLIKKGYTIVAFARKAKKIMDWAEKCDGFDAAKFEVVEGGIQDAAKVKEFAGKNLDCIISALGSPSHDMLICGPGGETLAAALKEMEKKPRVVWISSHACNESARQTWYHGWCCCSPHIPCLCCGCMGCMEMTMIIPCMIGKDIWTDMERGEDAMRSVDGLKLVIVRPCNMLPTPGERGLSDGWLEEHKGLSDEYITLEADDLRTPGGCMGPWMPRTAIATFMVDCVDEWRHDGKAVSLFAA